MYAEVFDLNYSCRWYVYKWIVGGARDRDVVG